MIDKKLSIIIPVYNEKKTIIDIINKLKTLNIKKQIIVVDDASSDGTEELLNRIRDNEVEIYFHNTNRGKAYAIKTAQKYINGDTVVIQDADFEYEPKDIKRMFFVMHKYKLKVIYGNRFYNGFVNNMTLKQKLGNFIMTFIFNILFGTHLKDIETCYKMIQADIFKGININSYGFAIEPEITAQIIKRGIGIKEIPINYYPRTYREGKKIKLRDGIISIIVILQYFFKGNI